MGIAVPSFLISTLAFLLVIGVLVFVHEFGHYAVGRLFGMKVEVFSIGFGREIVGRTDRHGTRWKIGWLPLGGYAKFAGDLNGASMPDPALDALPDAEKRDYFQFRPLWQRALVVFAGPAVNFLFAILLFFAFFLVVGQETTPAVIEEVGAGTPAATAGLRAGDRIVAVDGHRIDGFEDLQREIVLNLGTPLALAVERAGRTVAIDVTPRVVEGEDGFGNRATMGFLGIAVPRATELVRGKPVRAAQSAVRETWNLTRILPDILKQVVTGARPVEEMGGPVRIAQVSGQMATIGIGALVSFSAFISINLGFMNLLPVPMLDGGHLFLYALEAVRRRPLSPRVQEWAFLSGFALLMSVMLLLTWNDLRAVGVWKQLATGFQG